jgi:hypothetical protein
MNPAIVAFLSGQKKGKVNNPADMHCESTQGGVNSGEAGKAVAKLVATNSANRRDTGKGQSKPVTSWPKTRLVLAAMNPSKDSCTSFPSGKDCAPQSKDRDTQVCSICRRLASGVKLSKIFCCDSCEGKLGTENVMEINEMWD